MDTSLPPRIIDPVLADASERTGLAPGDIAVVRARPARWRDGSLGCPQPGRQYTQALVDGYWIVLRADGRELDYRLGSRGGFRLCESGGTEPLPREDV